MSSDDSSPPTWLDRALARLGRALDPDAQRARAELHALRLSVQDWQKQHDVDAHDQSKRVRGVESSLKSLAHDALVQKRDVTRVRQLVSKERDLLSQMARLAAVDERSIRAERRVLDRLSRLTRDRLPIIVGPWTGEVGFELLYWIPFVQWASDQFRFAPDRLVVVSRGGVRSWYGHISERYEEIFRHATPEQFHAVSEERKKQHIIGRFDRTTVRRVMKERGMRQVHLLHPTLMYDLYKAFWRYDATVKRLEAFARFRVLRPVDAEMTNSLASLPAEFVAVRFYFSSCFPDTPENRRFAARVVDGLAARTHVVLLNNDILVDDHRDFTPDRASRVHTFGAHMQPETNLAVQTAVISRASAFVGTYGGYSYLAPLHGVSSVAFYSHPTFKQHHLELAQRAFQRIGRARLVPLDVASAELLGDSLAGVVTSRVGS